MTLWFIIFLIVVLPLLTVAYIVVEHQRRNRALKQGLPGSTPVDTASVMSELERFRYFWRHHRWERWGVTSAHGIPGVSTPDCFFMAGTSQRRLGCILVTNTHVAQPMNMLVGRSGIGYGISGFQDIGTFRVQTPSQTWKVDVLCGQDNATDELVACEAVLREIFMQVIGLALPKPHFVEITEDRLLVVFELNRVMPRLDAMATLHARLCTGGN